MFSIISFLFYVITLLILILIMSFISWYSKHCCQLIVLKDFHFIVSMIIFSFLINLFISIIHYFCPVTLGIPFPDQHNLFVHYLIVIFLFPILWLFKLSVGHRIIQCFVLEFFKHWYSILTWLSFLSLHWNSLALLSHVFRCLIRTYVYLKCCFGHYFWCTQL